MGFRKDGRHAEFGGPETLGPGQGYRLENEGLAQAKYSAALDKEGTSTPKARLARVGRTLRRLLRVGSSER